MKNYWLLLFLVPAWLMCACGGETKDAGTAAGTADSLGDTLSADASTPDAANPPASADGLFDDFIYNFMRNRTFQTQRIKFPLKNVTDGRDNPIELRDWHFDPLYSNDEVYTMLFDNDDAVGSEKDTALTHVNVEWIYLDKSRVKQYQFVKERGRWLLAAIDTHALKDNPNSDFYAFYHRFAGGTLDYQQKHITNPFSFVTYDPDELEEIDGVLDVAQWADFRPTLPDGTITNIDYGQTYSEKSRVLVITSPSAGMACTLKFKKTGGTWKLVGMKTI